MKSIVSFINKYQNYLILLLFIIALFSVSNKIPTEDGGLHISTAEGINKLHEGNNMFSTYITESKNLDPNILSDIILGILLQIFSVFTSEKIMLVLITILFIGGFIFFSFQFRLFNSSFLLIIIPFAFSYPFHLGLYNYLLSVSLFWISLGFYEKSKENIKWKYFVLFAFFSILTMLSHIVPGILLIIYFFSDVFFEFVFLRNKAAIKKLKFLFIIIPLIFFISSFINSNGGNIAIFEHIKFKLLYFFSLSSLYSFHEIESLIAQALSILLVLTFIFLMIRKFKENPRIVYSDKLIFLSLAFFIIYLAAPNSMAGGDMLICRLSLFPYLFLLSWIVTNLKASKWNLYSKGVIITSVIIFSMSIIKAYISYDKEFLKMKTSATHIEKNKTILFLSFSNFGYDKNGEILSKKVAPLMNAEGYIAAQSNTLGLTNQMAYTGYARIDFRKEFNPQKILHNNEEDYFGKPKNILCYMENTPGTVDYIILRKERLKLNQEYENEVFDRFTEKDWASTYNPINKMYQLAYASDDSLILIYKRITPNK